MKQALKYLEDNVYYEMDSNLEYVTIQQAIQAVKLAVKETLLKIEQSPNQEALTILIQKLKLQFAND